MNPRSIAVLGIVSVLAILGATIIVMSMAEGQAEVSNTVSYELEDYQTGKKTTYQVELIGYAESNYGVNDVTAISKVNYKSADSPTPYITKDKTTGCADQLRVPVIYSVEVDGSFEAAYLIEYRFYVGTNGSTGYFTTVASSFRPVDIVNGQVKEIGASTANPYTSLTTAIIPESITLTIPDIFTDEQGTEKDLYTNLQGCVGKEKQYELASVDTIGGAPCIKQLIILGQPRLKSSLLKVSTLESVVFGGGAPTEFTTVADKTLTPTKNFPTGLKNFYFDTVDAASFLSNDLLFVDSKFSESEINVYVRAGSSTQISDKLTMKDQLGVNFYFSEDSVLPQSFGNGKQENQTKSVSFYIHKNSLYWNSYKESGKIVARDIDSKDIQPQVYGYPANSITMVDSTGGTIGFQTKDALQGQAIEGNTVELIPSPDSGYILKGITLTYGENSQSVSRGDDGLYSFVMPGQDVTVTAQFDVAIPSITATQTVNGSQIDITVRLNGVPSDGQGPDKVCIYVKYGTSGDAYSFSKVTMKISEYKDGYELSASTSMTSLQPLEYLVQVFAGDVMLNSKVVELNVG